MRVITLLLLLCTSLGTYAATFSVPGADITFDAPNGFTSLSKDEISVKFPSNRTPSDVVGNRARTTTITFELKQDRLAPEQLAEVKQTFEQYFEAAVPRLEWKERKIVDLNGMKWIQLEFSSRATDTDIHNVMLITSRYGRMLIFNFNSTRSEFPSVARSIRASILSIKSKPASSK